jgi:hypothetical protein
VLIEILCCTLDGKQQLCLLLVTIIKSLWLVKAVCPVTKVQQNSVMFLCLLNLYVGRYDYKI